MSTGIDFLNTDWVSMQILRILLNELEIAEYFSRDWQGDFDKEFAPGSTITVKFPTRPTTTNQMAYNPQGLSRASTTITLDEWVQSSFEWDDYEQAVKLERSEKELEENYFQPTAAAIRQDIDSRCAEFAYQNASNVVGALGTDPTSVSTYYDARRVLKEEACPPGGKKCLQLSTSMVSTLGSNITNFFQPADELVTMFKEGSLGRLAGFDTYESNSLYAHTAGTAVSATVSGANQDGTQIKITGTAGQTFKKGDKIAFALVNRVNPATRRIAGKASLRSFTVTEDLTLTGGTDTVSILPAIYGPGDNYQNVDALPANGAAITLWPGTTNPSGVTGTVGLALSRFAFAIVGAKLYVPKAVEQAGQAQDPDSKLAVRKVKMWDGVRSMTIHRMDSLFGKGNLYQANGACCVPGA